MKKRAYRCYSCWSRCTGLLPKRGRCPTCGAFSVYVDKHREKRDTSAQRCDCLGYTFPHRRGSLKCVKGSNPYGLALAPDDPPMTHYVPPADEEVPF